MLIPHPAAGGKVSFIIPHENLEHVYENPEAAVICYNFLGVF